ncbi:ISKra4 family transposase [Actinoplanes subtropicus]|uniref:ISKra4 family transposase n=1 Tax=Actinoplanes subtropicus TaxID=543632 RepID=UPI0012F7EAFF|nr:ISKra4 family transposase [Actinoplanes subtropicus]
MAPYPCPEPGNAAYAASWALFDALITRLGDPLMAEEPEHAVEQFIAGTGRDVLRQALQDHLDARAAAERRLAEVTGADQVPRRRAEPGHTRLLSTTLGRVEATRIAYRHPGVSNLHPADVRLALPAGRYSFPLQEAVVHESVTGALREARDGLDRILGARVGTRQLMQITIDAAQDVRDFYSQHPVPAPAARPGGTGPRDLLVLSIDATGVNMIDSGLRDSPPVRDDGPRPPSAQLSCRKRTGRTRMAVVTAVYDAAPAVRSPADIMPADATERATRRPGPKAVNRQVDASIVDSTAPMTRRLFDRAQQRDPQHRRRWIVLVDGNNHQIDRINAEAHARGVQINLILDFVHVLEYLWKAAEDLHPTQPGRASFVARTARDLLEHHPARVIADLNSLYDTVTTTGDTAPGLKRCIDYLTAKQPYLIYRIALTMGWPIATGVIEGTCRYLVKDRLAITGARWSLPGAEAVLLLRAVITNGDFPAYWKFHLQQEHQRTHTSRYQHQYDLAA